MIPAAGAGSRMGAALPKQYLELSGKTVLEHSVNRIASHPLIHGVMVVIAPGDQHFQRLKLPGRKTVLITPGGAERCHSVFNGLSTLAEHAAQDDWVLVHDAARPCVRGEDITRLIDTLRDHPVGGLLGVPVADTMKRSDREGNVIATVEREGLWRALTPQMFRLGVLHKALAAVLSQGLLVTDEAQAVEAAGHAPRMVEGHADNIKITRPQDLALAQLYLQQQEYA